ncbi:non-specific lipid-transfer protein A-like [Typha latifolia]|uniref:non-specific lipid-transfer protein A-like n=1 Tax=Typha latifolia TaxID=4733 RepID=UPI003C2EEF2A
MTCMVATPTFAMSCGDVIINLGSCMMYLTGHESQPFDSCCDGVRHLKSLAATTADRRMACSCMRVAAAHFQGLRYDRVNGLPGICSVSLPFPINLDQCDQ